jgi:hypothetical protein
VEAKKKTSMGPINVSSPICFHLNRVGNGNDDISTEEHSENSKTRKDTTVIYCSFLIKYFNPIL